MADESRTLPELIAALADRLLAELDDLVAAMNAAEVEVAPDLASDRAITAEMTASNRANLTQVLHALVADPLATPDDPPPEALDVVRTVVRRGLDLDVVFQSYRRGQNVVWSRFMEVAPTIAPPGPAHSAMIERFAEVLFTYVDRVLVVLVSEAQRLREEMLGGALGRRTETVRLILDGAPIEERVATERLGYDLPGRHTALVLWRDERAGGAGELETAAGSIARALGAGAPLTISAGARTLWAWIATRTIPTAESLAAGMAAAPPEVRAAVGSTSAGIAGFRTSHADAVRVAQIVGDHTAGDRIVTRRDVAPLLAMAGDEQAAARFVGETLGALAVDDERGRRLRTTLRIFLAEADNASRVGELLHAHRNTVLQRVARAGELLGHAPGERRLAVMLALDLAHFVGPKVLRSP